MNVCMRYELYALCIERAGDKKSRAYAADATPRFALVSAARGKREGAGPLSIHQDTTLLIGVKNILIFFDAALICLDFETMMGPRAAFLPRLQSESFHRSTDVRSCISRSKTINTNRLVTI